jgi:hypothetical protein
MIAECHQIIDGSLDIAGNSRLGMRLAGFLFPNLVVIRGCK